MSSPTAVPGARATLFLSLAMSLIGIGGAVGAYGFLTLDPSEVEPGPTATMFAAMADDPMMLGVQVGNLLASGLLVVASMLLTIRRPTAIWWSRQAIVANVLYALASAVATVWFGRMHPEVVEALLASGGEPPPEGTPILIIHALATACGTLIMLAVYGVMIRVVGREDVRSFVAREAR